MTVIRKANRIVLFNWRDLNDSRAGGAERYTDCLLSVLARSNENVIWFTSRAKGQSKQSYRNGYQIIRRGSERTCFIHGAIWLILNKDKVDLVIDEVNTLPWLSPLIIKKKIVLLSHQLARTIWRYEMPRSIAYIGEFLEPLYMRLYKNAKIITVSDSSAKSLRQIGLTGELNIIENVLECAKPISEIIKVSGRIGFIGRLTRSKRIDDIIIALGIVRKSFPVAHLVIIGGGDANETKRLTLLINSLGLADAVQLHGFLPVSIKEKLLSSFDILALASVREGWGLVVSEAARYYIPTVAYPVPGLVDSIIDGVTGKLSAAETPTDLAVAMLTLLQNPTLRDTLARNAALFIEEYTIEHFEAKIAAFFTNYENARPSR